MGRGQGPLQREILTMLEPSRHPGKDGPIAYGGDGGWLAGKGVSAFGFHVEMADGVYDLRAVLRAVAQRRRRHRRVIDSNYLYVDGGFRVAFSRAVKGLVRRGALVPMLTLPYAEMINDQEARRREELWRHIPEEHAIVVGSKHSSSTVEDIRIAPSKQTRFVRLAKSRKPERDVALAYFDRDIIAKPRR